MVSINFELDNDGHFYNDVVADPPVIEKITVTLAIYVNINYINSLMQTNINILLQHPLLQPYATAKFKLVQIFKTSKSQESLVVLRDFCRSLVRRCENILFYAHLLFWQDPATNVRSPYEFDDILKECIEFGIKELELNNKIFGMRNNYSIQSIIINDQLKQNVKNNVKRLGYKYDKNSK